MADKTAQFIKELKIKLSGKMKVIDIERAPDTCHYCGEQAKDMFLSVDGEPMCDECYNKACQGSLEYQGKLLMLCTRCGELRADIEPRYSFGIYAGKLCVPCCSTYRDGCGINQAQGDVTDLDEFDSHGYLGIYGEDK